MFLRGVNVGGHRTFRPAVLAKELSEFEVVNVGAAGTFVVRTSVRHTELRAALKRKLSFETEQMICRARDVLELIREDPFHGSLTGKDVRRFVTVLAKRPRSLPRLPIVGPATGEWQVKVIAVRGVFALSLWRRLGKAILYPNAVVEKAFGVPATTRAWDTLLEVRGVLEG